MKQRIARIDAVRGMGVVAALAIHVTAPWIDSLPVAAALNAGFRWGVPLLFMVSGYATVASRSISEQVEFGPNAVARIKRLLTPYLFWSAVAVLFVVAKTAPNWNQAIERSVVGVLTGSAWYHLWFFGTLITVSLITLAAGERAISKWGFAASLFLLALGMMGSLMIRSNSPALTWLFQPAVSWVYSSPLYWLLAFQLGMGLRHTESEGIVPKSAVGSKRLALLIVGAGLLAGDAVLLLQKPDFPVRGALELAGGYLVALSIMLRFVSSADRAEFPASEWVGVRGLGVFAAHPFALLVLLQVTEEGGFSPTVAFALSAVGTLACTLAYVVFADRIRPLRFTVR